MPSVTMKVVRKNDRARLAFLRLVPEAAKEIDKALEQGAQDIAASAKQLDVPVTGKTQASINAKRVPDGMLKTRFERRAAIADQTHAWGVFAGWWWRFKEFGTVHQPAAPFMVPAQRLNRKRVKSRISRAINKAARAVASKP